MITFNGKRICPIVPVPKVGQVWKSEKYNKLLKIYSITIKGIQAAVEYENGEKAHIGFGWFDGDNYTFVGNILK